MKALILAAGYGTRLQRDLRNDQSGNYNELLDVPKPLLPIGTYPLCSHLMMMLKKVDSRIDKVYLVVRILYVLHSLTSDIQEMKILLNKVELESLPNFLIIYESHLKGLKGFQVQDPTWTQMAHYMKFFLKILLDAHMNHRWIIVRKVTNFAKDFLQKIVYIQRVQQTCKCSCILKNTSC